MERILAEYYDDPLAGPFGAEETLQEIQTRYSWPGMWRTVSKYVSSCHLCTYCKPICTVKQDVLRLHTAGSPWEFVALDLMGLYPRSTIGKRFLLVVTDMFARWFESFPIVSSEAHLSSSQFWTENSSLAGDIRNKYFVITGSSLLVSSEQPSHSLAQTFAAQPALSATPPENDGRRINTMTVDVTLRHLHLRSQTAAAPLAYLRSMDVTLCGRTKQPNYRDSRPYAPLKRRD